MTVLPVMPGIPAPRLATTTSTTKFPMCDIPLNIQKNTNENDRKQSQVEYPYRQRSLPPQQSMDGEISWRTFCPDSSYMSCDNDYDTDHEMMQKTRRRKPQQQQGLDAMEIEVGVEDLSPASVVALSDWENDEYANCDNMKVKKRNPDHTNGIKRMDIHNKLLWSGTSMIDKMSTNDFTKVLAFDLDEVCRANEYSLQTCSIHNDEGIRMTSKIDERIFCSSFEQPFSLEFYIGRLVRYISCSRNVFIIALIYLDRLQIDDEKEEFLLITRRNVHRLLLTAVVLACKWMEDENLTQGFYAKCGGILMNELNRLELDMLLLLNWNLNVDYDTFKVYEQNLLSQGFKQASSPIVSSDEES